MKFKELYQNLTDAETNLSDLESGNSTSSNLKEHLHDIRRFIYFHSLKVFLASKEEDIYWSHCSTATYFSTFDFRLEEAIKNDKNNIHNDIEFVESEIKQLNYFKDRFSSSNYHFELFNPINKKIRLLEYKKQLLNPNEKEELLDFSDSSVSEKIIYLHKLGVLDFLRKKSPFIHSTNKFAEYLSAVTGENVGTLQSYLNPIYSPQTDQKNNPLNKKAAIERIEKHLNIMGISE
jgi:hypothetical protein